jgi:hypothetical protein
MNLLLKNVLMLSLIVIFSSCIKSNNDSYSKLEFKRLGGGNKEFFISSSDFQNLIQINFTKYNFKDTTFVVLLNTADIEINIFSTIKQLFNNKINIDGEFKQPTLPTGTWAYFYMIDKNSSRKEITNIELRDLLLLIENAVEKKLKKNNNLSL